MGSPMGRPRIGTTRRVVIPDDVLLDLKLVARLQGVPVSQVLRDAYRHYVDHVLKQKRGAA